ncbi:glycosyltransferase [Anaerovibrio sp. JC8]|uniref:UDP-2,4-diacetamido-2,4, 6-trideoxy-beta-L-altropyranose hydrolase n=1 Tax=Anaerovibrio sp. JC8 TaxID=1240085 RepID=UPI000A0E0CC3|nr:UDP-2,4-diacetamido-2,4,6-trideoxy-beta-L-altropyranose hydrolase [Anaerovibrio sp. JC8]ORU01427.1 glycosyltransferase [Anaerovibrio sp. JC8]
MNKLYFRVDMNESIATGHVMRCLSIAAAARKKGLDSIFITADENAKEIIKKNGFQCLVLNSDWNKLDNELPQLREYIQKYGIKHLLVDTYQVTEVYLRNLSQITEVTYLDDMGKVCYDVQRIICYANYYQNLHLDSRYETAFKNKQISQIPSFVLGISYAPLRECFVNLPLEETSKEIQNILILSGGTDELGVVPRILSVLKEPSSKIITAICGKYSKFYGKLQEEYKDYENIEILSNVSNIEYYMKKADVAISAAGTTIYELCACGTPTIIYTIADNQLLGARQMDRDGIMLYAGDFRVEKAENKISELLLKYENRALRESMSQIMKIDGCGAKKIVEEIFYL